MIARWALCSAPLLLCLAAAPHRQPPREAYGPPPPPTPYDLCEQAVIAARTKIIPETLLPAISRVESGKLDPVFGRVRPWPWTINVEGTGSFYDSKAEAIAAVQAFQAKGIRSIDVGCMQVNLMFHPTAFATLDDAFDPPTNAAYAVRFLTALYGQTKDWSLAAAYYHSQSQLEGEDYQRRVFGRVMTPMGPAILSSPATPAAPASPYGAFAPAATVFGALPPASSAYGAFAPAPDPGPFAAGPGTPKAQPTARR